MKITGATAQADIDQVNAEFWDELCGTTQARELGIEDRSPASLKRFDDWYFDFYPYLAKHIPFAELAGQRVLEVGLGYGSVSQKIATAGADYVGLDIAAGPVAMVRERLSTAGIAGTVLQDSILNAPFEDGEFDRVIAIGCLHHTGNLAGAIREVYRLLKPGGRATIMVYNARSYRQLFLDPLISFGIVRRRGYDMNTAGQDAPQTEFVTKADVRKMCRMFATCRIRSENIGSEGPLRYLPRTLLCRMFGPVLGLDLYILLEK